MKHRFKHSFMIGLAACMAAVSFTSCSDKDDASNSPQTASNQISFYPSVLNAVGTRATAITPANLNSLMKNFGVMALSVSQSGLDYFLGSSTSPVTYTNDGSGTFTTSKLYYWPEKELNFVAYSPVAEGVTMKVNAPGSFDLQYSVPADQSKQVDLLYATATSSKNKNGGVVPLQFKHVLSQVKFAGSSASGIKVVVKGITIHQVINGVRLVSDKYVKTGNYTDFSPGLSSPKTLNGSSQVSLTDDNGVLMLPPQKVGAANFAGNGIAGITTDNGKSVPEDYAYLVIDCNIYDSENSKWILGGTNTYKKLYVPVSINWEAGKCYTYVLNFTGSGGFGYDEDGNITAPTLTYKVSVDEWQNGNQSPNNL